MAIDASIYQSLLRPVKSVAEYDAEAMQLQQNRLAMRLGQAKVAEQEAGVARTNRLGALLSGFTPGMAAAEQGDVLTRSGFIDEGRKVIESGAKVSRDQREAEKAQREAEKFQFEQAREQIGFVNQIISSAKDQASYSQGLQAMAARGMDVSKIPERFDPSYVASAGAQTLTQLQRIDDAWKAKKYDLEERQFGETVRSNKAQDADRDASRAVTVRGQNMTDARTREATRGQIIQTDDGPMLANPLTGTARPVVGSDGAPIQAKLKPLPAPVQKALMENDAALKKVDRALAAVQAYPAALGAKNYLGDTVRQRTDPKGIEARALVADIGSLKIHDRSGAAVTAAEAPRLKPFIPTATDDDVTVVKKLRMFKEEYDSIKADINANYSREQGYRLPGNKVVPNPVEPAPNAARPPTRTPPASPAKNAKGWTLHTDAKGNRAYVSPDGSQFEEVK